MGARGWWGARGPWGPGGQGVAGVGGQGGLEAYSTLYYQVCTVLSGVYDSGACGHLGALRAPGCKTNGENRAKTPPKITENGRKRCWAANNEKWPVRKNIAAKLRRNCDKLYGDFTEKNIAEISKG